MDWHQKFKQWSKPPTDTEEAKASTPAELINKAVRDAKILENRNFRVYPTGSYRNNTNIKLGSDVDIALVLTDAFFYTLPAGRRLATCTCCPVRTAPRWPSSRPSPGANLRLSRTWHRPGRSAVRKLESPLESRA